VCGKTARTVRRAGRALALPDPIKIFLSKSRSVGATLAANIPERKIQRRIRGQARSYKIFLSKPRVVGAALAANIPERKTQRRIREQARSYQAARPHRGSRRRVVAFAQPSARRRPGRAFYGNATLGSNSYRYGGRGDGTRTSRVGQELILIIGT
jgi:hypothetical protein